MFKGCFKGISRKIEGCFKGVIVVSIAFERSQREFQRSFKDVSSVFQGSFKDGSSKFLGCSKEASRVFQESLKEDWRVFQWRNFNNNFIWDYSLFVFYQIHLKLSFKYHRNHAMHTFEVGTIFALVFKVAVFIFEVSVLRFSA